MNDTILQKTKSVLQVKLCIYQEYDFLENSIFYK